MWLADRQFVLPIEQVYLIKWLVTECIYITILLQEKKKPSTFCQYEEISK